MEAKTNDCEGLGEGKLPVAAGLIPSSVRTCPRKTLTGRRRGEGKPKEGMKK